MAAKLSYNQLTFARELAAKTGLNGNVVAAWLLQEQGVENANPASSGLYNFLNVGVTGSGNFGTSDSIWNNPLTAADATAGWLMGVKTAVPGWERSSPLLDFSAIRGNPQAQITAIQQSGFATSGEPSLPALYQEAAGGITPTGANSVVFSPGQSVTGQGVSAVKNAVNSVPNTITGVWNSFTSWIPKFALEMLLIISGLGLLVMALARTTRGAAQGAPA